MLRGWELDSDCCRLWLPLLCFDRDLLDDEGVSSLFGVEDLDLNGGVGLMGEIGR